MKHYPSQMDLQGLDKLERVVRDIYNRIYDIPKQQAQTNSTLQSSIKKVAAQLASGGGGAGGGSSSPVVPSPTTIIVPAYGSMWANNISQTVVIAVANTYYAVNAGLTAGLMTIAFNFVNNSTLQCETLGTYLVNYATSLNCAFVNQDIEAGVMINSVIQPNTTNHHSTSAVSKDIMVAGTGIIELEEGDLVQLAVNNNTAIHDITVEHMNMTLVKIS